MSTGSGLPSSALSSDRPRRQRLFSRPSTRLGWWSVGLMVTFILLMIINGAVFMQLPGNEPWQHNLLPFYGFFMLACGLAAGVVGLIAVIRKHERSWLVWLAILPLVFVVFLLLGEFLGPPH